ncbi:MAG: metallophosphoesterase [Myxococcales bacterium]|nr:metallophosphoesterase [Myxococcales bacterium]
MRAGSPGGYRPSCACSSGCRRETAGSPGFAGTSRPRSSPCRRRPSDSTSWRRKRRLRAPPGTQPCVRLRNEPSLSLPSHDRGSTFGPMELVRRFVFQRPIAVVGDLHGQLDLLDKLLLELGDRPLVVVGDVIDRGPDTRGVVARLIERGSRRGPWQPRGVDAGLAAWRGPRSLRHPPQDGRARHAALVQGHGADPCRARVPGVARTRRAPTVLRGAGPGGGSARRGRGLLAGARGPSRPRSVRWRGLRPGRAVARSPPRQGAPLGHPRAGGDPAGRSAGHHGSPGARRTARHGRRAGHRHRRRHGREREVDGRAAARAGVRDGGHRLRSSVVGPATPPRVEPARPSTSTSTVVAHLRRLRCRRRTAPRPA